MAQGDEAAGDGACVGPEAILRKPEAAYSGTSMEPEAIIREPEAAGSGACVEPEQAKNNPKPSPLLGHFPIPIFSVKTVSSSRASSVQDVLPPQLNFLLCVPCCGEAAGANPG